MVVDVVGWLLEMGFSYGGKPKGFNVTDKQLTLWIQSPAAKAQMAEVRHWIDPSGRGQQTGANGYQRLSLTWEDRPDVWVVSSSVEQGQSEQERWLARGFRARLVETPESSMNGLVVSLSGVKLHYRGYLPRHPQAGQMVQAWH